MAITECKLLVTATVWTCNFCGHLSTHLAGTGAPLAVQHFIETLRWVQLDADTVACERCSRRADIGQRAFAETTVAGL
ncbi:hypothetical protein E3O55_08340 [Cryobacterium sp. MDB1-18-2]|uniref:hypothetical protein n=1 Tax=unclassified Cryobacterium TaxID=2649013 RepID=UPI00106CBEC9|nr:MULTISPECIES: hypothetical protein [unclassified Cryobacterium]TFC30085.1 hypothetical protein E3O55_08340 [Cryobacterium sp. MDB1-18-2]TFC41365.1 hypothetical protein E3O50_09780 [Cryobacterium sp. MDB1-18-1]